MAAKWRVKEKTKEIKFCTKIVRHNNELLFFVSSICFVCTHFSFIQLTISSSFSSLVIISISFIPLFFFFFFFVVHFHQHFSFFFRLLVTAKTNLYCTSWRNIVFIVHLIFLAFRIIPSFKFRLSRFYGILCVRKNFLQMKKNS